MYKVEPIISKTDRISLPSCMYEVKNIHGSTVFDDISTNETSRTKIPEIAQQVIRFLQEPVKLLMMLEERQDLLLKQLESLRIQMVTMKTYFQSSQVKAEVQCFVNNIRRDVDMPKNIVIKANPAQPPYSLLCLQKLLNINISCHTHSSIVNMPSSAEEFSRKISNCIDPCVSVTLIWKEVDVNTELVISSTMPVVICGEVNMLRYFISSIPNRLSYNEKPSAWEVDSLLDICHRLQDHKTAKERQSILKSLNSSLGKQQWLTGSESISIVDIAAQSIIKQGRYENELTINMKNWLKRCEECDSF